MQASDDDDLGAYPDAAVKVHHVLDDHAEAAIGGAGSDRLRRDGAVDAQMRVLLAVIEVDGAGAERVLTAAGHAVLVLAIMLGLTLLHVQRRDPARPFLLVANRNRTLELQAF